jgi:succinyl-diaminopimelate desuccinylase
VQRIGDNLVLGPARRGGRPLVALVGHLDTVPPSKSNPVRREGDRLFGLGASDMKSGLALIWQLIEQPVGDPAYDLAHIFYSGEEGPFEQSGLIPVLQQVDWLKAIDLAICLEPSDNVLQLGCNGTLHASVIFEGRAAHSARPWQGQNAIHLAAPLLADLGAAPPREVQLGELVYREVISATLARGGTAANVVPDRFAINVNYRFAPDRSLASAQQVVRDLVGQRARVEFTDLSPAGPIPADNAVLADFRRKCPVTVAAKQGWTDVARLAQAGIDAVNFGPGPGDQAHQPDEYLSIPLLLEGERLLRAFLSR